MAAARLDCHNYVNSSVKDVTNALTQHIQSIRHEMESEQNPRATDIELRMQKMLWEAKTTTQTTVVKLEEKIQNAMLRTQEQYHDINNRLDTMSSELEQRVIEGTVLRTQEPMS
ncbi:hypothetical protein PI124_g23470 [Phytophthora idaei]|nr:hypothetical protein PI126_g23429 [Phytophthora idaei]KAG3231434.1 hypothetical protein PI124_g23470 [Phytophthora idaei]